MLLSKIQCCAVIALSSTLAPALVAAAETASPESFESARIAVESGPGAGPDVILLPGLATPGAVWEGLVADLEGRATVHVVDVKGFGVGEGSENANGGLMQGILADLADFVESRDLEKPALIGHSLGGTLALKAGIETPDLYGRLMVVDALPFVGLLFDPEATVESVASQAAAMRDGIEAAAPDAQAEQTAERYALDPDAQRQIADWIAASDPATVAQAFYEDMQADLRPGLAAIGPPVTLVVPVPPEAGEHDVVAFYDRLYAAVPDLITVPIKDARHFVMLDRPDAMAAAVTDFLGLEG